MPGETIVAYAADFYIPENIIGYTGVLSKNPTVYFLSRSHYGHITQVHDNWKNVGREPIRSNEKYWFGNTGDSHCLTEGDTAAGLSHRSRSPIVLVGLGTPPPELTHAIMVHSEQKALHSGRVGRVTPENRARQHHPGQQPTDEERGAVPVLILFRWAKGNAVGVPVNTRLYTISG